MTLLLISNLEHSTSASCQIVQAAVGSDAQVYRKRKASCESRNRIVSRIKCSDPPTAEIGKEVFTDILCGKLLHRWIVECATGDSASRGIVRVLVDGITEAWIRWQTVAFAGWPPVV